LLNNEMDDFSAKPGVPNSFGLLGGAANAIAPGKRPLSSMTPTMVFRNDQPFLITGSPGGSRIISTVLQHVVNMIDHRANVAEALSWPRIHHQWYPDRLEYELGLNPDTIDLLQGLGHNLQRTRTMGSIQAISVDEGRVFGAADPRRPGAGAVAE
jgi:gamma-glutamyltranspeptidase/glutathione hydrolase